MEFYQEIAFTIHEHLRMSRPKREDGSFEPDWQLIKDKGFIDLLKRTKELPGYIKKIEEGNFQIDISNADFMCLSPDWQKENMTIGKLIERIIQNEEKEGHFPEQEIGSIIHKGWLQRHPEERNGEKGVPYSELPVEEQKKYIEQYKIARKMFEAELADEELENIEDSIKFLAEAKEKGQNIKFEFWGDNSKYTLYSLYDDIRTSYLKICGRTKEEIEEQEEIEKIQAKAEGWKEKGKEFIYSQKWDYWFDHVESRVMDKNHGKEIEKSLIIMEALDQGKNLREVAQLMIEQTSDKEFFDIMMQTITLFSKRGPELYKAAYKKIDAESKQNLDQLENENKEYSRREAKDNRVQNLG